MLKLTLIWNEWINKTVVVKSDVILLRSCWWSIATGHSSIINGLSSTAQNFYLSQCYIEYAINKYYLFLIYKPNSISMLFSPLLLYI